MIEKKEIYYKSFGRCLEITNSIVRLAVTLDFGPRIIRYSFLDGKNIMFEDTKKTFGETNSDMEMVYGTDAMWKIYGGHRLWIAPEDRLRTYYPDNAAITYKLTNTGAVFSPPIQSWTGYGYTFRIDMRDNSSDVIIEHCVTNHGSSNVELSLWPITVLSPGGVEIVPQPTKNTGYAPRTHLTFWDYVKMTDKRLTWLDKYIILKQDSKSVGNMKFGINSEHGFAMYFNHGNLFVKQFAVNPNGNYPDGGMSFETFTNPLFLEMESLGELKSLSPGETTVHTENWSLYKEEVPELTDCEIEKLKQKYITLSR